MSSKFKQEAISGGSDWSLLPASISFCKCLMLPKEAGSFSILLLVRISQRLEDGKLCSPTLAIWLDLKLTILRSRHCERTSGISSKSLLVKKTILRCFNRSNSSGKVFKWLFDRSKISKESARVKISEGN